MPMRAANLTPPVSCSGRAQQASRKDKTHQVGIGVYQPLWRKLYIVCRKQTPEFSYVSLVLLCQYGSIYASNASCSAIRHSCIW